MLLSNIVVTIGFVLTFSFFETSKAGFVDLTYALSNDTVNFPGRVNKFNTEMEGYTEGGLWVASKGFCISEHTATHIDAPYHFHQAGKKLDEIPLEDLIDVPGVMLDVYDKVHRVDKGKLKVVQNYAVTKEDILEWEKRNGVIPPRSLVLLRSGWGSRWPDAPLYLGLEPNVTLVAPKADDAPSLNFDVKLNYPGFDATAAQFLSSERQIVGVGVDTLSIDVGSSKTFPAHVIFAARGKYMLEMVANLHLLPPKGFRLWAIPMKIDRGTGSPTRVIARIPDEIKNEL